VILNFYNFSLKLEKITNMTKMNDRLKDNVVVRLFYSSLQVLDITFLAYYGKECFDTKSRIISNTRAQATINITTKY